MLLDRDRSAIEKALAEFDRLFRHQRAWQGWAKRQSYLYAIEYNGQLYPPNQIVSIATGVSVRRFNGGHETNAYLEARGFKIIPLHSNLPASPSELPWFFRHPSSGHKARVESAFMCKNIRLFIYAW